MRYRVNFEISSPDQWQQTEWSQYLLVNNLSENYWRVPKNATIEDITPEFEIPNESVAYDRSEGYVAFIKRLGAWIDVSSADPCYPTTVKSYKQSDAEIIEQFHVITPDGKEWTNAAV